MINAAILNALKALLIEERLETLEAALRLTRSDLSRPEMQTHPQQHQLLAQAAQTLLHDYTTDKDLTAFTS